MAENVAINRALVSLACLVLALAAMSLCDGSAQAESPPHLRFARSATHSDILVMLWSGPIKAPMSTQISAAFEDNKAGVRGVELKLNSSGGSVKEGERVIAVLQGIKKTHKLYTSVGAGKKCGSMCVFIFVQGEKRLAAPASLWLFHEVSVKDRETHKIKGLDRSRWEELVDKYWVPAGVNQAWIEKVKAHTVQTDFWESGESLLHDGSNLITRALSDEHRRLVGTPPQQAAPSNSRRLPPGDSSFVFRNWSGPPLKVYAHLPQVVTTSTPIVFVMHGQNRNARTYRSDWSALADADNFILITPRFSKKKFHAYSKGAIQGADKQVLPTVEWAFAAIEPMFNAVREMTGSTVAKYAIYGHSAGAQFVHRFVLLTLSPRVSVAVAANAGSYAMPVYDVDYPFGLRGAPIDAAQLKRAFAAPLVILLGSADTNPNHSALPRQPEAMAQGPHRVARGEKFFATARDAARQLNTPFNWQLRYAQGVEHSDSQMAAFAAPLIVEGFTH